MTTFARLATLPPLDVLGPAVSPEDDALRWREFSRSADGLFWYEIAQIGKIAAIIAEGANMYATGRSTDPKLAQFPRC